MSFFTCRSLHFLHPLHPWCIVEVDIWRSNIHTKHTNSRLPPIAFYCHVCACVCAVSIVAELTFHSIRFNPIWDFLPGYCCRIRVFIHPSSVLATFFSRMLLLFCYRSTGMHWPSAGPSYEHGSIMKVHIRRATTQYKVSPKRKETDKWRTLACTAAAPPKNATAQHNQPVIHRQPDTQR